MSVEIECADGRSLKVNAWNWGVLHHLVAEEGLLPDEVWAHLRSGGGELEAAQVTVLAGFLERAVLVRLAPDERIFFDGTVTDVPDDGTFYRAEDELWRNYSLHHDVLTCVIAFLRAADGPVTLG